MAGGTPAGLSISWPFIVADIAGVFFFRLQPAAAPYTLRGSALLGLSSGPAFMRDALELFPFSPASIQKIGSTSVCGPVINLVSPESQQH